MKFIIDNKEIDLIPFKNNPTLLWDGKDDAKTYKWEDLTPRVNASNVNSSYSAARVHVKVKASGSVESSK